MYKVSHSAIETYNQCSEKYRLRYIERLDGIYKSSALFFGVAMDNAFSRFLVDLKKNLTEEEKETLPKTPYEIFQEEMDKWKDSDLCDYYKSDFDPDVLGAEDFLLLESLDKEVTDLILFHESCARVLKNGNRLAKSEQKLYNMMSWLSLCNKGHMMLKAYELEIVPKIKEVFEIQKNVHLENSSGDIIRGLIDFTCEFKDELGIIYICDNKTSSKSYSDDSVRTSDQLSTYCESEGLSHAAYVVVEKKIRKRDPRVRTQIIKDIIPEEQFQKTFDNIQNKVDNISSGDFHMKDNQRDCYFFGKRCEYYLYCWSNGSITEGLKKREERK